MMQCYHNWHLLERVLFALSCFFTHDQHFDILTAQIEEQIPHLQLLIMPAEQKIDFFLTLSIGAQS